MPARGPIVEFSPQRWSKQDVLVRDVPSVLTHIGHSSQEWDFVCDRASTATKDKLLAVYNAKLAVLFKTPQNTTGFNIVITRLFVRYAEPADNGRFYIEWTAVAQ